MFLYLKQKTISKAKRGSQGQKKCTFLTALGISKFRSAGSSCQKTGFPNRKNCGLACFHTSDSCRLVTHINSVYKVKTRKTKPDISLYIKFLLDTNVASQSCFQMYRKGKTSRERFRLLYISYNYGRSDNQKHV